MAWRRLALMVVGVLWLGWLVAIPMAQAKSLPAHEGEVLFSVHCVGCHPQGGNIIRRSKTLKQKALQRNGLDSIAAITTLIQQGKSNMPAYRDRLTSEEIDLLGEYVWAKSSEW
jgi:cytochrome c6